MNMFMKHWISIFYAPNYIFSDNEGEFIGDDIYGMRGKFNIKVWVQHHSVYGVMVLVRDIIII